MPLAEPWVRQWFGLIRGSVQFSQAPSALAVSGLPLVVQPIVQVLNPQGVLDVAYSGPVTLTVSVDSLLGTATVNAILGIAAFVGIGITGSGLIRITASAPGRATATTEVTVT